MANAAQAKRKRRAYAPRLPAEQRRTQLLDAALHLVVTQGHAAATVDAIAEQAGVTKPVVYGLYPNRRALLAALLDREQEAALAQIGRVVPASLLQGSQVDLASALDSFLRAVQEAPERWQCIVMPMPDMPAEFHAARERARNLILRRLENLLRLPDGLDPQIIAHSVVTLAEMAARLVLTDPRRFRAERFVTTLRNVLIGG